MSGGTLPRRTARVAVDLPGAPGERLYDYLLPEIELGIGDGVLVPFGSRRAVGIIVALDQFAPEGIALKTIAARIGDRPLLSEQNVRLAEQIAMHWAAPLSVTLRALLPPGLLDKVEQVARLRASIEHDEGNPDGAGESASTPKLDLSFEWQRVDALPGARGMGRPALLRELKRLEENGVIERSWRVSATSARSISSDVVAAVMGAALPAKVGPRQRAAFEQLTALLPNPDPFIPASTLIGGAAMARRLVELGLARTEVRREQRVHADRRAARRAAVAPRDLSWSSEQQRLLHILAEPGHRITLLDGPPGSGKSRAAASAAAATIARGGSVLWLVPEVAHAALAADLLAEATEHPVELVHSGMSRGERLDAYDRLASAGPHLVVGTRAALAAVENKLGLIVLDEEHESGYKSDRAPRLHARDAARMLAADANAPLLLISATPTIESLARAGREHWQRVTLQRRGDLPKIEVVDLRQELEEGWKGMLSRPLLERMNALRWEAGEQALLIINRRGLASALLCRDCGAAQSCPTCERPMVLHSAGSLLRCHGCGIAAEPLTRCPSCDGSRIRALGGGTEKLEAEARTRFPELRIDRLDADVAGPIGAADRILDRFRSGETDILVGTALAAKSLNLPGLALVGIVSADTGLLLPDERAAERTVAFIVQACGRLGRGAARGVGIVQSYRPEDPAIVAAVSAARGGDVAAWRDIEIARRQQAAGAPFARTAKFSVAAPTAAGAHRRALALREALDERAALDGDARRFGPIPAWTPRRAGRWREQVILRCHDPLPAVAAISARDVTVDLDPETLL